MSYDSGQRRPTPNMLTTGSRLGPYEIHSLLGKGGMGEVYRARDGRLDRDVAIKVIAAPLALDPQFRQRFEREARVIGSLDHPGCVRCSTRGSSPAQATW